MSATGRAKVALIENVDRLQESARNALLKTLEEPPPGVFFVLTTQRRGAVIATILSRARSYGFAARGPEESARVITRIFRDSAGESPSIRDYFARKDGQALRPLAERFLESVVTGATIELGLLDEINQAVGNLGGAAGFRYFVDEMTVLLQALVRASLGSQPAIPARRLERWRALLNTALTRFESYNTSTTMTLEGLYYGMRKAT
jgi:DNA polymerase-3 subunit gamma/tau